MVSLWGESNQNRLLSSTKLSLVELHLIILETHIHTYVYLYTDLVVFHQRLIVL